MANELWIIEWTYSPANYFEKPLQISEKHFELVAQDGKVEAKVDHNPRPDLCDQLDTELKLRFQEVQLVSRDPYKLSQPSVHCHNPEGTRIFLCEGTVAAKASVSADFKITDKNGNVIADSRAERIEKKRSLGILAAKHGISDSVARKILQSYNNAIDNPDNCFFYLYEITDALKKHFGNDNKTVKQLKLSKTRWRRLKELANAVPLKQGRHRGKMISGLRNANRDELDTSMDIAVEMVEKYLKYLDEGRT